ncbi:MULTISPECIES: enoyl-CoA hydratase/isomerase family protein [Methylobacterium]|jgi:enoyl-CoA hydratase|uniref:enoyl-CoA hydratase/isomerase family protein n=2 Tax=Methylobacteriaceae TaxID=119045 RepID=UPI0008EE74C6|nr:MULTISPECIES: enoyl-CoA hydratase/isomerase family protein [Methylobacterium]MBK3400811.1 enoyl-CoA hydratase/isomerase family protein [Methylobacterium ajmalii]MBK3409880.1 enoyl-CoA hydratase/isomerase family protein [Methylobacterium ajmalii]MBZ6416824.1 enoyl-CoA hydratase/isomerase family protein [Methylobacterium sp.]SFF70702.1 enoyl-CoA hydratase [Methylobacterium sp. yr596]
MGDAGGTADNTVLVERRGAAGFLTLNRPKALNALTLEMVRALRAALDAWAADPEVTRVVIQGAGERAFCAGGDIRRIHEEGSAGRHAEAETFFREEYELNALIQRYPKPYVALIDGIVMGGGVGVSLHGSHRVAAERTAFAMPETGIGFFPDVGATYALPRLPGFVGTYLALTGERIGQGDVVAFGLATHAAPASAFPAIRDALAEGRPVEAAIGTHEAPAPGPLHAERALVEACFSADDVAEVLSRLDAAGSGFAKKAAATIRTRSPTSLHLALAQMRRGAALSFPEAMRLEYRILCRILRGHDFYEGVRSVLIDRDGKPDWQPATLEAVTAEDIEAHLAPMPGEPSFT